MVTKGISQLMFISGLEDFFLETGSVFLENIEVLSLTSVFFFFKNPTLDLFFFLLILFGFGSVTK